MDTICQKCGYERKPSDSTPNYECPSCGIIYTKYKTKTNTGSKYLEEDTINGNNEEISNSDRESEGKKNYKFRYIIIIIIITGIGFYSHFFKKTNKANNLTSAISVEKNEIKKTPIWNISESKDEMTGKYSAFAISKSILPSKKFDFPYENVTSWIGVGCSKGNDWAFIGFNIAPNLTDTQTKDGYNSIFTRIKWNEKLENIYLNQTWGEKFIRFVSNESAVSNIASSDSVLLELQWHGQGTVYFKYPLEGSWDAIAQIRAKCAAN